MTRTRRIVFLSLSGVCAVSAVLWWWLMAFMQDVFLLSVVVDAFGFVFDLLERLLDGGVWVAVFFLNPFPYAAVFFFVKGFLPGKHTALKCVVAACIALLSGYIAMVAFVKVDFVSTRPIWIACGLTPILAALFVMLFYGSKKWHRILCSILAVLALCASTFTFMVGAGDNERETIGYAVSPGGRHRVVVVRAHEAYVACPMTGLLYWQDDVWHVNKDVLQEITWRDENTAQLYDRHGYPRIIKFK